MLMDKIVLGKAATVLRENIKSFEDANFMELFAKLAPYGVGVIGAAGYLMYSAKIPFYKYLKFVPDNGFFESDIESIDLKGIVRIGHSAFAGCEKLKQVTSDCESLGSECFANSGLTAIPNLPNVINYPVGAFYHCVHMEDITIPEGIAYIGSSCFDSCLNLRVVKLPSTVIDLSPYSFAYCPSLTDMYYPGTMDEWTNNVAKHNKWLYRSDEVTVHCSDGELKEWT